MVWYQCGEELVVWCGPATDWIVAPTQSLKRSDYMEHDALRSMHGHAPVVHDRLVTDHHEIHHTIDSGIKSSCLLSAACTRMSPWASPPRTTRGAMPSFPTSPRSHPTPSRLPASWSSGRPRATPSFKVTPRSTSSRRPWRPGDLRSTSKPACSLLAPVRALRRLPQPPPRLLQPRRRLNCLEYDSNISVVALAEATKYGNGCDASRQHLYHAHHPWRHVPPHCWRHAPPFVWHREFEPPSHHHWRHAPLHRRRSAPPHSRCLHLSHSASYKPPVLAPTFGAMRLHCHVLASINSLTSPLPDLHHHVLGMTLKGTHPPPSPHLQPSIRSQLGTPPLSTAAISP